MNITTLELLQMKFKVLNTLRNLIANSSKFTKRHVTEMENLFPDRMYFSYFKVDTTFHLQVKWGEYSSTEDIIRLSFKEIQPLRNKIESDIAQVVNAIELVIKQDGIYLENIDGNASTLLAHIHCLIDKFQEENPDGVNESLLKYTPSFKKLEKLRHLIKYT